MDHNSRLFVTALRDACNRALEDEDGRVGEQDGHIETIEVTDTGSPILLRVTCFGSYSPTEARRVHADQGVIDVMSMVARFMSGRALYDLDMEKLKGGS